MMLKAIRQISAVFLVALVAIPLSVDLIHLVVLDHHHQVCNSFQDSHVHSEDSECDILQFYHPLYTFSAADQGAHFAEGIEGRLIEADPAVFYLKECICNGLRAPPVV